MEGQDGASTTSARAGAEHKGQLDDLRIKVAQLEQALASRILIEQAKGVLSERFHLSIDEAFELLRRSARSARTNIHDIAARVVNDKHAPTAIVVTLDAHPASQGPTGRQGRR